MAFVKQGMSGGNQSKLDMGASVLDGGTSTLDGGDLNLGIVKQKQTSAGTFIKGKQTSTTFIKGKQAS